MQITELLSILKAPLTPAAGVMFILIGLYSLFFNTADARRKNHQRAEKVARIGGWFYIIGGAILILRKFLF